MSTLPGITASGLALVARADRRLAESAHGFTRAADDAGGAAPAAAEEHADGTGPAAAAGAPSTDGGADLVDAALGVVYGRAMGALGVKLLEVGRDTEKMLVDVLA